MFPREVPGTDVSSSVETDKENDSSMVSEDEQNTTDQLLDSTYNKPVGVMYGKSPLGKSGQTTCLDLSVSFGLEITFNCHFFQNSKKPRSLVTHLIQV